MYIVYICIYDMTNKFGVSHRITNLKCFYLSTKILQFIHVSPTWGSHETPWVYKKVMAPVGWLNP